VTHTICTMLIPELVALKSSFYTKPQDPLAIGMFTNDSLQSPGMRDFWNWFALIRLT